ncbi:hypothetical protein JQ604_29115 [Bradyrhizobium jicamae]|uniref:hypothetical protein n=1 Tax=Bradyrhizobium jicamae TaxID=280332 RepID=UPI001BA496F2|nr:hypothetical protein [Bradyrhizobium jicamae]MBR0756256.1 hypothetical protein [Bradyrhizobium jicamae]
MNIGLQRLLEGILATLRDDVIPHVTEPYARGQAVGVIDLLNNIGPRLEWARGPLLVDIEEKRAVLHAVAGHIPGAALPVGHEAIGVTTDLQAERDRLDGLICDVLAELMGEGASNFPERDQALALIRGHLHDSLTREMKLTRKPLFAEIASGKQEPQQASAAPGGREGSNR